MLDFVEISNRVVARLRQARAGNELRERRVVIMHDFSLDRMVPIEDYDRFDRRAREILRQKGGILVTRDQDLQQGGCGANTATTLARLGVPATFITRTNELGLAMIQFFLGRAGVDISHVKLGGRVAFTVALEVGPEKINIMVDDVDSFAPFGFDDLTEDDLERIESADLVGIFDWSLNRSGTDLASRLLEYVRGKEIITYLDTSDPAPRRDEIPDLIQRVLSHPSLSYLSLNENELKHYAGDVEASDSVTSLSRLARHLDASIPATLNVHTASFSMQVDEVEHIVPTYRLQPVRTTGAGDSWNGGNILGLLLGMAPVERLLLANAVAGFYVTAPTAQRPDLDELSTFIQAHRHRLRDLAVETAGRSAG